MRRGVAISLPMRPLFIGLGFGTVLLGVACGGSVEAQQSGFGRDLVDDSPAGSSGSCFCEVDARGLDPQLPDASSGGAETDAGTDAQDASDAFDAAAD